MRLAALNPFQWCEARRRRRHEELRRLIVEAVDAAPSHFHVLLQRSFNLERHIMSALDPIASGITSLETSVGFLKADNAVLISALKSANDKLAAIAAGAIVDPAEVGALSDRITVLLASVKVVDDADKAAVAPAEPVVPSEPAPAGA